MYNKVCLTLDESRLTLDDCPEVTDAHRHLKKSALSFGCSLDLFRAVDKNMDGRLDSPEIETAIREVFGLGAAELPDSAISTLSILCGG